MRTRLGLAAVFVTGLISVPAFAVGDFSGHWVAESGKVSSTIGVSSTCSRVELVIEQDQKSVLTRKYEADCQLFGSKWGPVEDDIQGAQVLEGGEVVGTISDDTLLTTTQDGSVAYAYNLKLVRGPNGETLLKTYYGTKNGIGAIVIEADLHKVGD